MELKEFLDKVVGSGSLHQNDDGLWKIQPYEIVIEDNNRGHISGFLSFKGERFQDFSASGQDIKTVEGFVESLNHGYTQAIKDVIINGNIGNTIKPFKFV